MLEQFVYITTLVSFGSSHKMFSFTIARPTQLFNKVKNEVFDVITSSVFLDVSKFNKPCTHLKATLTSELPHNDAFYFFIAGR